ncbi:MAG: transposase [Gammaproteobacteria bacterium]|nr:transposase [Gammaproteobacteria bacterium]
MPRANRYYLAGHVWHITHRCHKQQFLLRFARDRRAWVYWLYQARRRYGLCVLNYVVTSNHIHLLVRDQGGGEIASSMQLIAGRVAQQFNRRKSRKGAYWEDRYHATAVQADGHLARCMVYIDLNMVRAGVVDHPSEWVHAGYSEIQSLPERYRCIDVPALAAILGFADADRLREGLREWVDQALAQGDLVRQPVWTESIAVGQRDYLDAIGRELTVSHPGRAIEEAGDCLCLSEEPNAYLP